MIYLRYVDIQFSIGKTWSARILQWINNLEEWYNNHRVIVASFLRVVYLLKYRSNAYLSCLDNGSSCWNTIYLECQNVVGVLQVSRCLAKINTQLPLNYQSNAICLICVVYLLGNKIFAFASQKLPYVCHSCIVTGEVYIQIFSFKL